MVSVSDILKLLDQVPIWKTLKALPRRIAAPEKRIAYGFGKPGLDKGPGATQHRQYLAMGESDG